MQTIPILFFAGLAIAPEAFGQPQPKPVVELEEDAFTYTDSNNGSFPLWTYGSTILARAGDNLFLSATETIPDAKPLNCVRWVLMKRTAAGWQRQQQDETQRTREPCPIASVRDGRLFLSVNPPVVSGSPGGPARPLVLEFSATAPKAAYKTLTPVWQGKPAFSDHSYRGFACDPESGELLLVNVEGYRGQHWSFRDREGKWSAWGFVEFPAFDSYKGPLPMRYLYPAIGLRNRSAHMFTKGGIEETIKERAEWRRQQKSGIWARSSLGYAWTPDISRQPFSPWINAVDVMATGGQVWNCDLWVAPDGDCHLLWHEASIDVRLRPKFLANVPLTEALNHGVMHAGKMVRKETLARGGEGIGPCKPVWGRFHATADGRLYVFYAEQCGKGAEKPGLWNRIIELKPGGGHSQPATVPLKQPLTMLFMTAAACGGTPPSDVIEVVGRGLPNPLAIRYARTRLARSEP
jgi:hypothetical protein